MEFRSFHFPRQQTPINGWLHIFVPEPTWRLLNKNFTVIRPVPDLDAEIIQFWSR
jgi:hypothetical protein